jgi:uncharacterized protein YjlB
MHLPDHCRFPNASSGLPVVFYRPFDTDKTALDASAIEALVSQHGFKPQWRYPMFDFDHFHSTTHELLVPFRGRATLVLGGTESIDVKAGDVILLPAGVAHRAEKTEGEFYMVGSYPSGAKQWDTCRGGEEGVEDRIKKLQTGGVNMDPVYGLEKDAPVMRAWNL